MNNLKQFNKTTTVDQIFSKYKKNNQSNHRPHLGGSQIGMKCERALWYQFHWCQRPNFEGRMLRLFDHGNWEEKRIVKDLRDIGIKVYEVDPSTGRQFHFTELGGHLAISLDGAAKGFSESKKWHVLEFKTASDKSFNTTQKNGVYKDKKQHYAQMQLGMGLSGLNRAFYFMINKNNDDIYGERLHFDKDYYDGLIKKASRVIFSEEPLPGISNDPAWYECKFCDYHNICHGKDTSEMNCRTCCHATPKEDGKWHCGRFDKNLSNAEQRQGCYFHLYNPYLIRHSKPTNAGEDYVEYKNEQDVVWYNTPNNGKNCYSSREVEKSNYLPVSEDAQDTIQSIKDTFGEDSEVTVTYHDK